MKFINITNETLHFNGLPAWEAWEPMEVSHEWMIYAFENNSRQVRPLRLHKEMERKKKEDEESKSVTDTKTYLDTSDSKKFSKKKKVKSQ